MKISKLFVVAALLSCIFAGNAYSDANSPRFSGPTGRFVDPGSINMSTAPKVNTPSPTSTTLFNPTLPYFSGKAAATRNGTGDTRILFIGDSITSGAYSNDTASTTSGSPWAKYAFPARVASMLSGVGYNTRYDTIVGCGNVDRHLYNADIFTIAGSGTGFNQGWVCDNVDTIGGARLKGTAPTAGVLTYTPTVPYDTATVWYYKCASCGTLAYSINGAAAVNINTSNATPAVASAVISMGSVGKHTLTLNAPNTPTAGNGYVLGVEFSDSTKSEFIIANAGWGGSVINSWVYANSVYSSLMMLQNWNADLVVIGLGTNDIIGATDHSTFKTKYQTLITAAALGSGDIALISPPHVNTAGTTNITEANQTLYRNDIYALAAANDNSAIVKTLPVIDLNRDMISWAYQTEMGINYDDVHFKSAGYELIARDVMRWINPAPVGNGVTGLGTLTSTTAGVQSNGQIFSNAFGSNGVKFTTSGAGCTVTSTTGGATSGQFGTTTTGTCTTTITMNGASGITAPTGWTCWSSNLTSGVAGSQSASSQTTATIKILTTSGDTVSFGCMAY